MNTFGRAVAVVLLLGTYSASQTPRNRHPEYDAPAFYPLQKLAIDFWAWRAVHQPYSTDDIPRIERPHATPPRPRDPSAPPQNERQRWVEKLAGQPVWTDQDIDQQRKDLKLLEQRWNNLETKTFSVADQVDYRLLGSALARVRWELDVNRRLGA